MKDATTRGIWIGFAVLLVLFAAVALYAVRSLEGTRDSPEKTADIGDKAGVAVAGMQGGVAGIGRGTIAYARTDDPKHREDVVEARDAFERERARYEDLVGGPAEGDGIEALYDEYETMGESLLDKNDKQEAARGRIDGDLAAVKRILGGETRENVGGGGSSSPKKLEEMAKMSGAVAGVEGAFEDYLRDPTPERSKSISSNAKNFRVALGRFEKLPLDEGERGRAADLRERFDGAISGIQETLSTGRAVRADERRFASLRAELEAALGREVRELRREQAARAEGRMDQALGRTRALIFAVLAAVVVVLAAVFLVATGVVARAWRGVVRLAWRLREMAGKLLRGDIRLERRLLPLGIALGALLWIAQSVLEAYPFGGGDLPGALLPERPAEWLGRGATPVALVAFLAYVQFVLNRRSKEQEAKLRGDRRERENEARSRLVAVVESSDDAIMGRTLDGVITSWNSGARRLYGYGDEEVVGSYGFELAPPDRLNEMLNLLEKLRNGGERENLRDRAHGEGRQAHRRLPDHLRDPGH